MGKIRVRFWPQREATDFEFDDENAMVADLFTKAVEINNFEGHMKMRALIERTPLPSYYKLCSLIGFRGVIDVMGDFRMRLNILIPQLELEESVETSTCATIGEIVNRILVSRRLLVRNFLVIGSTSKEKIVIPQDCTLGELFQKQMIKNKDTFEIRYISGLRVMEVVDDGRGMEYTTEKKKIQCSITYETDEGQQTIVRRVDGSWTVRMCVNKWIPLHEEEIDRYDVMCVSPAGLKRIDLDHQMSKLVCGTNVRLTLTKQIDMWAFGMSMYLLLTSNFLMKRDPEQGEECVQIAGQLVKKYDLSQMECRGPLGAGTYGNVLEYISKSGEHFAVKFVKCQGDLTDAEWSNYKHEIDTLCRVGDRQCGVIDLAGVAEYQDAPMLDEQRKCYAIVLPCITMSLDKLDLTRTYLNDTDKVKVLVGIAHAMQYLHDEKVVHRDLKPGNVLIDIRKSGPYKISGVYVSDLGAAREGSAYDSLPSSLMEGAGSPAYMAPELMKYNRDFPVNTIAHLMKCDVFSYGALMQSLLTHGENKFLVDIPADVPRECIVSYYKDKVVRGVRPEVPTQINDLFADLMERCWSGNRNLRPDFDEIVAIFESSNYMVTPKVNAEEVIAFVKRIREGRSRRIWSKLQEHIGSVCDIKDATDAYTTSFFTETASDDGDNGQKTPESGQAIKNEEDEDEKSDDEEPGKKSLFSNQDEEE